MFIPFHEEHLAAVIAMPDEEPRGLVVLLTGAGANRSHRFQIWTRTARRLAQEHGLASVRLDYNGMGDSTAVLREWKKSDFGLDQTETVARFAMRAAGVDRVVAAGNCVGGLASLELAAELPECVGAACIRAPLFARSGPPARKKRTGTLANFLRSHTRLRRAAGRIRRRGRRPRTVRPGLETSVRRASRKARLLFLYGERDHTFSQELRTKLASLSQELPPDQRSRVELRVVSGGPLKGFESGQIQDMVVDTVVGWAAACFAEPARAPSAARTS